MTTVSGEKETHAMVPPTRHNPLPLILVVLTVTTGLVDAVSVLGLGRVFTANMTGNIVFLGFAVAGVPGFSVTRAVVSLVGFLSARSSADVSASPWRVSPAAAGFSGLPWWKPDCALSPPGWPSGMTSTPPPLSRASMR